MSDNWLRYVPVDPYFQPSRTAAELARVLLTTFLPQADEITAEFFQSPVFVDSGGNWSGVFCPVCGADAEAWWGDAVSTASEEGFASLDTVAPCCQAKVSLNELKYGWPAAFGRFVLDAMNPNVEQLTAAQVVALEAVLGCSLREIQQHI